MSQDTPHIVAFSDLDGTLLDEHYQHDAAHDAVLRLRHADIPLVLASSKTYAEMAILRDELAPGMPVIFENGCGIAIPPGAFGEPEREDDISDRVERFGPDYAELRAIVERIRREGGFAFRGFGDMTDAEVAERTGLPLGDAARARLRQASEPGVLDGDAADLERFAAALAPHELRIVRGGRFQHVMPRADKVIAMAALVARYSAALGGVPVTTIAAGDSENDADMLRSADRVVVVRRRDASWLDLGRDDGVLRSRTEGPAGWSECMHRILDDLGVPPAPTGASLHAEVDP